jgi:phosphoribosylanthranilate isomerase
MTPVRVKICGITRGEDARLAVRLGANAVGFVFWPDSPRVVSAEAARAMAQSLPALVARVGVFVDAPADAVGRVVLQAGLDVVQLHGCEAVEAYVSLPVRLIKSVTLESPADVERAAHLPAQVTVLVDATDPVRRGGTGQAANWEWAAALARLRPVMLAGGLSADNVTEAVRVVRPWAIDVSSGVESAPGVKDAARMTRLFAALGREVEGTREE